MDSCFGLTLMQTQNLHGPLNYIFLPLEVLLDSNKSIFLHHVCQ